MVWPEKERDRTGSFTKNWLYKRERPAWGPMVIVSKDRRVELGMRKRKVVLDK